VNDSSRRRQAAAAALWLAVVASAQPQSVTVFTQDFGFEHLTFDVTICEVSVNCDKYSL
jgi:hypothetical protein